MTIHPPEQGRWLGVGHSSDPDARAAGARAADDALVGADPALLIVFASVRYDLGALLAGIHERSGQVPLVGCSTAGEIAAAGPGDAGVVVTALGGPGFSIETTVARGAKQRLREVGAEASACAAGVASRPHRVLMLLTDGLAGDQSEIVRGAYGVVGAGVPLVGGCAGDDLRMQATHQLYGTEVLTDAVIGAVIGSDAPLGIGARHGWRPVGEPMLVTQSADNRVHYIDEKPALDVYLERLDASPEVRADAASFTHFAQTHPLGLAGRSGEAQVRFVSDAGFEDRSLGCIAEVPQGRLAWLMEGDDASVLAATDAACVDALAPWQGQRPLGLIAFDCIARRGVLGERGVQDEVERVTHNGQGAPVAGFYTYGEIARTHGVTGFHNQTLVVLAVG